MAVFSRLARAASRVDGVLVQAVIAGSLSFAHLHDLAVAEGQVGWKSWTYPLSVDLLTVAAFRRLRAAQAHAGRFPVGPWFWFLLALAASLAANVVSTTMPRGPHAARPPVSVLGVLVAVWPAVAFLGCTLLGHRSPAPPAQAAGIPTDARPAADAAEVSPDAPALPAAASGTAPAPALLDFARRVAAEHQQSTGEPIDLPTLKRRLGVPEPLARTVLAHLAISHR